MTDYGRKPLKMIAVASVILGLSIYFSSGEGYGYEPIDSDTVLGFITYLTTLFFGYRSALKSGVSFKIWEWVIYSIGWLFILLIIPLLILYIIYLLKKNERELGFWNKHHHRRIFYIGAGMILTWFTVGPFIPIYYTMILSVIMIFAIPYLEDKYLR